MNINPNKTRQDKLYEHFCRYVAITSQSDARASSVPSTEGQRELANLLFEELKELGLQNVEIDDYAIVTAKLPSNLDYSVPSIGFIAHLDTVDVGLNPDISPQLIRNYDGKEICLNDKANIYLRPSEQPEILNYVGDDIIFSDGTSVLGADNKSAISSIMVGITEMIEKNLPHGDVIICFAPDEEIGLRGVKKLDLSRFAVDFAYTIDCCEIGEIVTETFNACHAHIEVEGVSAHPMSAKGVLVNPTQVVVEMVSMLNRLESPENTDGTDGFIWADSIQSNDVHAVLDLIIRDHDQAKFNEKKQFIEKIVELMQLKTPKATIALTLTDTYANIADAITPDNEIAITHLYSAFEQVGVIPKKLAMRGGTDGSYLSSQGILTPNFFTGAHNFHSRFEFQPMSSFDASCQVMMKVCELVATCRS